MKINKKRSHKKLFVTLAIVAGLLIISGGVAAYYYLHRPKPTSETGAINYSPPSDQDIAANQQKKQEIIDQQNSDQTGTSDSTDLSGVSITISRVGKVDNVVSLRSVISGTTAGTCNATFTSGSNSFTKTFDLSAQPTYYACNQDFSIDLFSSGQWTIKLWISVDSQTSESASAPPFTI